MRIWRPLKAERDQFQELIHTTRCRYLVLAGDSELFNE